MLLLAAARGALAFAPSLGERSRGARPAALAAKKARKKRAVSGPPARAELPEGAARPKLVVFDLDNTLWTPELHTLRKQPKAGKDVALCGGAVDALFDLATGDGWRATSAAVASRAEEKAWAEALLESFKEFMSQDVWDAKRKQCKKIAKAVIRNGVFLGVLSMGQSAAWGLYDGWTQAKKRIEKEVEFPGLDCAIVLTEKGKMPVTGTMEYCGMTAIFTPKK